MFFDRQPLIYYYPWMLENVFYTCGKEWALLFVCVHFWRFKFEIRSSEKSFGHLCLNSSSFFYTLQFVCFAVFPAMFMRIVQLFITFWHTKCMLCVCVMYIWDCMLCVCVMYVWDCMLCVCVMYIWDYVVCLCHVHMGLIYDTDMYSSSICQRECKLRMCMYTSNLKVQRK
jgi:hypothetical protein